MTFSESFQSGAIRSALARAESADADMIRASLATMPLTLESVAALLSPAGREAFAEVAARAREVTVERFGRTMQLFAPLYLSNECVCTCTYCGFSQGLEIRRKTLRLDEVAAESEALARRGIRNVLLVSAEHPKRVNADYVAACIREAKVTMPYVALEIAAAEEPDYRAYAEAGCDGVVLYQETYDESVYAAHHLGGPKKKYAWRMDALERAAKAGMRHLGIGALLGLADWRFDALALFAHARFLERHCWRSQINISFPRINPAEGGYIPNNPVDDETLAQLVCVFRLAFPTAGIFLSTREPAGLRDRLATLGVTHMSAGSSTEPGGYEHPGDAGGQFELEDMRPPEEVASALRAAGYDPVFKDWETMTETVAVSRA
jgi:2-iminoacetate synthase